MEVFGLHPRADPTVVAGLAAGDVQMTVRPEPARGRHVDPALHGQRRPGRLARLDGSLTLDRVRDALRVNVEIPLEE